MRIIGFFGLGMIAVIFLFVGRLAFSEQAVEDSQNVQRLAHQIFSTLPDRRKAALQALAERGHLDAVPALIQALRFVPSFSAINEVLVRLVGSQEGPSWHDWMLWLEEHPEIRPFDGFDAFKADVMARIDENFRLFLKKDVKHDIRLEEIVWGGVRKDGIPALINPTLTDPSKATYLKDEELVFGVSINGDARAYPLRIMDWHEMFNDVIGGVPVALAYCTLCGSGILYETQLPPRPAFVFGSSGFLYRSNKLMYDLQTHSLWNQFTGRPVVGPLSGSGIELKVRPVTITSWKDWSTRHPESTVLSLDTGYERDYSIGRAYGEYYADPNLMFPARVTDTTLDPKDYVFVLRAGNNEKAWPLSAFQTGAIINESVAEMDVVLIGDTETRTVRAYRAEGFEFQYGEGEAKLTDQHNDDWMIKEDALVNAAGRRLERLPGHISYWFAWAAFRPNFPRVTVNPQPN